MALSTFVFTKARLLACLMLALFCASQALNAETIRLPINNNLFAIGDYSQGIDSGRNILILHGFLQTNEFYTVQRLADGLRDSDHHILTPNLSLGISQRKQTLACEAIHNHNMEQDAQELALWINWLYQKTKQKIVLIGHSVGNLPIIAYLAQSPEGEIGQMIDSVIFISPSYFGPGKISSETHAHQRLAEKLINQDNKQIQNFGLSFCQTYPSNAENYLSYFYWSRDKVRQSLDLPNLNLVDKTIIFGKKDRKIDLNWVESLNAPKLRTIYVDGANHFFDGQYEFELLDSIETLL